MEIGSRVVAERAMGLCWELKGGSISYLMAIWQKKVFEDLGF